MPDVKHFDPDAALRIAQRLFWRQGEASTGIQEVVTATGLSRSSLYATFGGKHDLYLAALRHYVEQWSVPAFHRLTTDDRGLPAIAEFYEALIDVRCTGEFAHWGCMVTNAQAGPEGAAPDVRALLEDHHRLLRDTLRAALTTARELGHLDDRVEPDEAAELLALVAYGVNLRSRTGADPEALRRTVATALARLNQP
ncbi:TetR/AcrR family transcriptional regulator [Kitasatospora sp. NPDC056531]|uniref:TetR/AcrR family transcriptional regulator n=1 Tax=Kitasatospora sp. NPDC056531 TaxID=3345856 RepID=UPI0036AF4323